VRGAVSVGHPYLLLTLLLVPAAVVAHQLLQRRRARYAVRFTNVTVLESVLVSTRPWRRWTTNAHVLLALATLCVAVARPHAATSVIDENATVVLVLDVSGSMHAVDVKPTRLTAAQEALHTFLDEVPSRLKVGLVLFAGEAQVAAPPSTDHELVSNAIDDASFFNGFGGTAIGDAIALAVRLGVKSAGTSLTGQTALSDGRQLASYVAAPKTSSLVSILFLSDGHQNRGVLDPLAGAARAHSAGVPVYTVALGTTGATHLDPTFGFGGGGGGFPGSPGGGGFTGPNSLAPDPATLSAIAHATGGEFFRARTAGALEDAYKALGSKLGHKRGMREVTDLFALGAALLLVLAGALAALWAPRLP
jgi:Ca-activated chloride channel family protein